MPPDLILPAIALLLLANAVLVVAAIRGLRDGRFDPDRIERNGSLPDDRSDAVATRRDRTTTEGPSRPEPRARPASDARRDAVGPRPQPAPGSIPAVTIPSVVSPPTARGPDPVPVRQGPSPARPARLVPSGVLKDSKAAAAEPIPATPDRGPAPAVSAAGTTDAPARQPEAARPSPAPSLPSAGPGADVATP